MEVGGKGKEFEEAVFPNKLQLAGPSVWPAGPAKQHPEASLLTSGVNLEGAVKRPLTFCLSVLLYRRALGSAQVPA